MRALSHPSQTQKYAGQQTADQRPTGEPGFGCAQGDGQDDPDKASRGMAGGEAGASHDIAGRIGEQADIRRKTTKIDHIPRAMTVGQLLDD